MVYRGRVTVIVPEGTVLPVHTRGDHGSSLGPTRNPRAVVERRHERVGIAMPCHGEYRLIVACEDLQSAEHMETALG